MSNLPPLPEPEGWIYDGLPNVLLFNRGPLDPMVALVHSTAPMYSASQMQSHAEQARAELLAELAQALCDDCENGVKWLNEKAADKFKADYPHLAAAMKGTA